MSVTLYPETIMRICRVAVCACTLFSALCLPVIAQDAGKLLVVDCLLPGRVHKLGGAMTFLTARRAVKTAAEDCELRGGEYVAYDRSSYATALNVWLPLANAGDKDAQTFVGEIFEKGHGIQPDYLAAAEWYRKAADQGYARARINLGFLYEKGLGVKKDPAAALDLYRQAAGLTTGMSLDGGNAPSADSGAEVSTLRRELEETRRQLEKAKLELEQSKKTSHLERLQLEQQRRSAESAGNSDEVKRLARLLAAREGELKQRTEDVKQREQQMEASRAKLLALQGDADALRAQLDKTRRQLTQTQSELEHRRAELDHAQQATNSARVDIEKQKKAAGAANQSELLRIESLLKQREEDLRQQKVDFAALEQQAKRYSDQAAQLQRASQSQPTPSNMPSTSKAEMAAPSITVIDPQLVVTRGKTSVKVQRGMKTREVIGKLTAPAGLLSFHVNDQSQTDAVDANGLFRIPVAMSGDETAVSMVAVDKEGKRSIVEFALVAEGSRPSLGRPVAVKLPPIDFGNYYALIIGNNKYAHLPRLETAAADAADIAELLSRRYGFKTTTLLNATRYQILSELNKLRANLTEKDNLMIYYAGHGELDKANLRGYWLPVDAERTSDANWISSVTIADMLNSMSVKHVLIVADSCYSGALTRSSLGQLESGMSEEARFNWLKTMSKKRVRTVLTSGGLEPVLDGGGGRNSVFAKSLLQALQANQDALEGQRLYQEISARVLSDSLRFKIEQVPEYAPIRFAGHESGDFIFLPVTN